MTLRFGRKWLAVPAVAGLAAFVACGVEEEALPEAPSALEQTRQELSWVDLGSNMGSSVTNGNVYGAANEFTPPTSCSNGPGGSDLSFKWTAPLTGSYTFSTTGSALDSVLHIYTFSSTTATNLLGCNDQESTTLNSSKISQLNLTADTQIRIIVDSYEPPSSRYGGFQLNIVPDFVPCPTAPSACHSAPGTWNGTGCNYPFKAAGTSCNDNNACTTGDVCNGGGTCGGSTIACNAPPNECHQAAGTCSNGACSYMPKPNGTACNMPPNQCMETAGVCSNGSCTYVPKAAGTACNDGLACTNNDVCNGSGSCGGATACNSPPGACYYAQGTCTPTGCSYAFAEEGILCQDGMGCTRGDTCNGAGRCLSGDDICSNGTMCTRNGCQPIG